MLSRTDLAEMDGHLARGRARIVALNGEIAELTRRHRGRRRERKLLAAFVALQRAMRHHRDFIAEQLRRHA